MSTEDVLRMLGDGLRRLATEKQEELIELGFYFSWQLVCLQAQQKLHSVNKYF